MLIKWYIYLHKCEKNYIFYYMSQKYLFLVYTTSLNNKNMSKSDIKTHGSLLRILIMLSFHKQCQHQASQYQ